MARRLFTSLAAILLAWPLLASAETLSGRVVGIADGDTLTLLDSSRQQHKIRLRGIDAPEKAQPFGNRSKQHLSSLTFGKDATAECYKTDRWGRLICTVYVNGQDVALAQLDAGMAWWFRKYANEQLPRQRLERTRSQRVGNERMPIRSP